MKLLSGMSKLRKIETSSLIKFCFQDGLEKDTHLKELNKILGGAIKKIYDSGEFSGKLNQTLVLHTLSQLPCERVILAGLGEKRKLNADSYRQAAGTVSRLTAIKRSKAVAFFFNGIEKYDAVQGTVEGFLLGRFGMNDYKTGENKNEDVIETIHFYTVSKQHQSRLDKAILRGQIIAEEVISARRLTAHPGNVITPTTFAEEAFSLAKKYRLKCTVLDENRIRGEKMDALMAVARGSEQPPRFVILEYRGAKAGIKPIVLIGKGITFDSGGISLKSALDMDEMKGDMMGGAVVMSVISAASRLRLPLNIVCLIPLAENLPSGRALKPGDIINSRKGKTIEIINTDCEGRLILADALDYAGKFKPQAVIDIATLTGAALYVLGYIGAPILGNNKKLLKAVKAASGATAEKVWEMPLWEEYGALMKSDIADVRNLGEKQAGTLTAAAFLENFIGDWPWVHIDIAYVDIEKSGKPYIPKGATGIGVRLLIELLSQWRRI
ncbi:MAG: leucyl aminopeptidase [candidate division Zixibacteria bacterium]|nr:leucyl aminopeptidase [candidate division Zixibacteria bacterium]